MTTLQILFLILFPLPAAAAAIYHVLLMLARFMGARGHAPAGTNASHAFAIVIPAHNEEGIITAVLQSCAALDYPVDKYRVFVVADNCSDHTAEVARNFPVECLERTNAHQTGKGYALEWAFDQILPLQFDAIVVLDADCIIERHALRVFDRCLERGDRALQANHVLSNPDASPISYISMIGNFLEYNFFYAPKSELGLAVMLVGTGMVFHRDVLETHSWNVHSAVEDAEYTLVLAREGIHVRFVANVNVLVEGAEQAKQLDVQRSRWAGGTLQLARRSAVAAIARGVFSGRILLADAGFTLLVLSRPLVLLHLMLTILFAALFALASDLPYSNVALAASFGILSTYFVYFAVGVAMVGLTALRARYLLRTPFVLARLMIIALMAVPSRSTPWIRTPR